jgi:hypothetical protein
MITAKKKKQSEIMNMPLKSSLRFFVPGAIK